MNIALVMKMVLKVFKYANRRKAPATNECHTCRQSIWWGEPRTSGH